MGLILVGLVFPRVDANPVPIEVADGGLVIPSSQEVHMPSGNVSIDVLVTGSYVYDISANCSFELFAESAADCTIAFAFSKAWLLESGTYSASLDIYMDGIKVNHTIVEWDDLSPDLTMNVTERSLEYCSYAVFNTTFSENQTRILDIYTTFDIISHGQFFEFRYAVGSGKYWAGQTNETVTIKVDDQTGLLSLSFHPQPSDLENVSATVRAATWRIDVDQFTEFWVSFLARQAGYVYPQEPWSSILGVAALILIIVIMARPPRKKRSQDLQAAPGNNAP